MRFSARLASPSHAQPFRRSAEFIPRDCHSLVHGKLLSPTLPMDGKYPSVTGAGRERSTHHGVWQGMSQSLIHTQVAEVKIFI